MSIKLDGRSLTIEKLVRIARERRAGRARRAALERIRVCRAMLEEKLAAHEIMYGTNTGIGEFSEVVLTDEQVKLFQRALVYNHAAGIGEPAPQKSCAARWPDVSTCTPTATPASAPRSPRRWSPCSTAA